MERFHFRSTSLVDLQAELHERDLLRQAQHDAAAADVSRGRRTAPRLLLGLLGRRPSR